MQVDSVKQEHINNKESLQMETFEYTYSARVQKEVEEIKRKYVSPREDKLAQLKKLDKDVERPGSIASITLGIIGILIFGIGMSCALVWTNRLLMLGAVIGCVGIIMMVIAYPVYNKITRKQREKIAPQILKLCQEIEK